MNHSVHVAGEREDTALAGLDGDAPPGGADCVVVLGHAAPPSEADGARTVRWLAGARGDHVGRVIAQAGERLWRRAPWPVRDAVFELPAPSHPRVLLAVGDPERRSWLARDLAGRGVATIQEDRLTLGALREVTVVVLATAAAGPLPAAAMAVLAARRVLVTGPCDPAFGLQPEVEFFPGEQDDDLVVYAELAARLPHAFALPRALGALAAERHRASEVYDRLATDLELELALT